MYKVIIVDDEQIIREGLKARIKWNELGFECVGVCENGREAISLMEKIKPDVVITDIHMPFVNGLQLIEYISENYENIRLIILSGYNDFEYVRKALNFGVYDYILKPITSAVMTEILIKLKSSIDFDREKNLEQKYKENLLNISKTLIVEKILNGIIIGENINEAILEKLSSLDIKFEGNSFCCAILDVDEGYNKKIGLVEYSQEEILYFTVYNISSELVSAKNLGIAFQNPDKKTVIIFYGNSIDLLEKSRNACHEIMDITKNIFNFTLTIGFSEVCPSINFAHKSYEEAKDALEHRFLFGADKIITIEETKAKITKDVWSLSNSGISDSGISNSDFSMSESKIMTCMKTNDLENLSLEIKGMFVIIKESHLSIAESYKILQDFIFKIQQGINELKIEIKDIFPDKNNIFEEIYRYKTLDEIEKWVLNLCKLISKYLYKKREKYSYSLIDNAIDYIKINYSDEKINIEMISKRLSISTSYFSTLFKSCTGETFIEYLTRIRIEKAKDLLVSTNLKTYEIAEKVGYSDPHYFSIAFKKKTGVSPTTYKEVSSQ